MGSGLHGENGLDPATAISILRTYVIPIMLYGLETLLPAGRPFDLLERQYKKMIKQILSLPINTADPAIYILSGLMPVEAEIHKRAINLFGIICRSGNESTEWQIAERQLSIKNRKNNSWFIEIRKLFIQYRIDDLYSYLSSSLPKTEWKTLIKIKINSYWTSQITEKSTLYRSLKFLNGKFQFGRCHPLATTITANIQDIVRLSTCLKMATGTYILQQNRAAYKNSNLVATCLLCGRSEETLEHFLLVCTQLEHLRSTLLLNLIKECSMLLAKYRHSSDFNLLQLIVNPYYYATNSDMSTDISNCLEPLCRNLCYQLHTKRYQLLGI
jgi:hypothetical protein